MIVLRVFRWNNKLILTSWPSLDPFLTLSWPSLDPLLTLFSWLSFFPCFISLSLLLPLLTFSWPFWPTDLDTDFMLWATFFSGGKIQNVVNGMIGCQRAPPPKKVVSRHKISSALTCRPLDLSMELPHFPLFNVTNIAVQNFILFIFEFPVWMDVWIEVLTSTGCLGVLVAPGAFASGDHLTLELWWFRVQ